MEYEQILQILIPILAGGTGVLAALGVFVSRIRALVKLFKEKTVESTAMKAELEDTRRIVSDLTQKLNYLVEAEKKRARDEKSQQK